MNGDGQLKKFVLINRWEAWINRWKAWINRWKAWINRWKGSIIDILFDSDLETSQGQIWPM